MSFVLLSALTHGSNRCVSLYFPFNVTTAGGAVVANGKGKNDLLLIGCGRQKRVIIGSSAAAAEAGRLLTRRTGKSSCFACVKGRI